MADLTIVLGGKILECHVMCSPNLSTGGPELYATLFHSTNSLGRGSDMIFTMNRVLGLGTAGSLSPASTYHLFGFL